jgi:uncharacterized phage protein (TIGR01671 family)
VIIRVKVTEERKKMREIKFRHWNGREMDYDPMMKVTGQKWCDLNSHFGRDRNPNNIDILMQYTGLKDKNGKEIYEGDVAIWFVNGKKVVGEVYYEGQAFDMRNNKMGYIGWDANRGEVEIIGNIYENPELLTTNLSD